VSINHFSARESAKNKHMPKTQVMKVLSNLLFGTDMFTFDTRLPFKHRNIVVNVQNKTFNFKSTRSVYGR